MADCFTKTRAETAQTYGPPPRHIGFKYLSYSTTIADHAVHRLQLCLAFGQAWTCLFLSVQQDDYSVTLMGGHMTMA